MTKRSYIRIVSYIGFILAVIVATTIISTTTLRNTKNQLEISYQQSLTELNECLAQVNTDITKSLYSADKGEIYDLSRDLYAQCTTAKNAMSRLPVSQMELNNAYKFLTQCSDYAQYVGSKIENGQAISDEEHKNMIALLKYCEKFMEQTSTMVDSVTNGALITENEVKSTREISVNTLTNSFDSSSKTFEDFPTLLYDGPYSDQVLNRNSALVKNSDVYTKEQCSNIAARALGTTKNKLTFETDDQSRIPCYTFKCGRYTVLVTKQGGYVKEILYSGVINNSNISKSNACNLAEQYLKKLGYDNMKVSYYSSSNNVCTINCVYVSNSIWYYGDLIKISVSLDDGKLIGIDASTYLTNHKERNLKKATLTSEDAEKRVSKYLSVEKVKKCVIPKENGTEAYCYEFNCTSKDTGEDALVYINCNDGSEEDIMLLLKTDNGTLVK